LGVVNVRVGEIVPRLPTDAARSITVEPVRRISAEHAEEAYDWDGVAGPDEGAGRRTIVVS